MPHLLATPRPSGAGITDDTKTWGDPSKWPSRITCVAVPQPKGQFRGGCAMSVVACDPGAYVRRISCGQANGTAAPVWQSWARIPVNGSGPVTLSPNWPLTDWLWDHTIAVFVEYAAPDSAWSMGGLDIAFDYEH